MFKFLSVLIISIFLIGCDSGSEEEGSNKIKPVTYNEAKDTYKRLKNILAKSDLETFQEYEARVQPELDEIGTILVEEKIDYYSSSSTSYSITDIYYDADAKQITIEVPTSLYVYENDYTFSSVSFEPDISSDWLPSDDLFNPISVTYDMDITEAEKSLNDFYFQAEFKFNMDTLEGNKGFIDETYFITATVVSYKLYNKATGKEYKFN